MSKKKAPSNGDRDRSSDELDFEQSLLEVEQIVARLEGGQLGLAESLQQYEMGVQRLKNCHLLLDAAEQRVNVLSGFDSDGNPILEPLGEGSAGRKASVKGPSSRRGRAADHDRDGDPGETSEDLF